MTSIFFNVCLLKPELKWRHLSPSLIARDNVISKGRDPGVINLTRGAGWDVWTAERPIDQVKAFA